MQVCNGRHGDQLVFDDEEHAEREALDNGSPEFPGHEREPQG